MLGPANALTCLFPTRAIIPERVRDRLNGRLPAHALLFNPHDVCESVAKKTGIESDARDDSGALFSLQAFLADAPASCKGFTGKKVG